MNETTELRDITGLAEVSWLPLAPIWWLLLVVILLTAIGIAVWFYRRYRQQTLWQLEAQQQLKVIQQQPPTQQLDGLAILLRRLAIHRYGRKACAGLSGQRWLQWLQDRDPKAFAWTEHGQILINHTYMPVKQRRIEAEQLQLLVAAVEAWSRISS